MKTFRIALIAASVIALSSTAWAAQRLSDDEAGRLSAEMDAQKKEYLDQEFNGRSFKELNASEKSKYMKKSMEIEKGVLAKNKVSQSDYSTTMMHASKNSSIEQSRAEHSKRIAAEKKAADEKKAAEQAAAESAKQGEEGGQTTENGVVVDRGGPKGISRSNEGGVTVERGTANGPTRSTEGGVTVERGSSSGSPKF